MESLHFFFETHWDHEPDLRKPLEINKTLFRFMGSFNLQDRTRIGAMNAATGRTRGQGCPRSRFMGSLHDFEIALWDYDPAGRRRGNESLMFFFVLRKVRLQGCAFRFSRIDWSGRAPALLRQRPLGDTNFKWRSVDQIVRSASKVYALYGKPENLMVEHPDCGHLFPPEMRAAGYRVFDQSLK